MNNCVSNKILVQLRIRQWSGKLIDQIVTQQSLAQFGGKRGDGQFTKVLVHEDYLRDLRKASNAARAAHNQLSLPWLSDGTRIITASMFHQHSGAVGKHIQEFNTEADRFCDPSTYGVVVDAQKSRLKTAFDIMDYPSPEKIRSLFDISVVYYPFPDAGDWRLELAEEEAELIKAQTENSIRDALAEASGEAISRYEAALLRFINRMEEYKDEGGRLHKSLISNLEELADILPKLNFNQNRKIDQVSLEIKAKLAGLDIDNLKGDQEARNRARDEALAILEKMR